MEFNRRRPTMESVLPIVPEATGRIEAGSAIVGRAHASGFTSEWQHFEAIQPQPGSKRGELPLADLTSPKAMPPEQFF